MANPQSPALLGEVGARYPDIVHAFEEVAVRATGVAEPEDLDELLRFVGKRICELLDVHRFSAYLQGEDDLFYGQVGYCRAADIDAGVKLLVSGADAFTAEIVASRAPVLVIDAPHDPRTNQRTMRDWGVRDMLGVPLVFADEVIGIIYVDNEEEEHCYTDDEIRVAEVFATLAALAVRQASLFAQLSRRALVIDRQRRLLEQVADAHRQLTETAVGGADVPQTLRLLASLLHKPVVFYTSDFEVAAAVGPTGAVEPGVPGRVGGTRIARMVREARPSGGAVLLPAALDAGLPYRQLVCPLMAEEHPIGYLGVIEVGAPVQPLDVKVAEQGATVLSLIVISERRQMEAEGQAREDFLTDLLHAVRDPEVLARRAPLFGVDLGRPHVVVRLALNTDPGLSGRARRQLVSGRLGAAFDGVDPLAVTVPGADVLLVALPDGPEPESLQRVRVAVEQVLTEMGSDIRVRGAAVSPVVRRVEDYPKAHRELRSVPGDPGRRRGGRPRVVLAGDLGVMRLVVAGTAGESRASSPWISSALWRATTPRPTRDCSRRWPRTSSAEPRYGARPGLSASTRTPCGTDSGASARSGVDPNDMGSLLDARFALQILDLTDESTPAL